MGNVIPNNYTSPQPGLLDTAITSLQSNAKGRVSQMLSPVVLLGQTTGEPTTGNPVLTAFGLTSTEESNPNQIINFTADPSQNIIIVLSDGTSINMTLNYYAGQQGWFYSFNYNNGQFVVNNRRLVTGPNMLSQFSNIIEFGFAVTTTDAYEPIFIDDFITGRTSFYILEANDVEITAEAIINAY
jgi:hypothetical protein